MSCGRSRAPKMKKDVLEQYEVEETKQGAYKGRWSGRPQRRIRNVNPESELLG